MSLLALAERCECATGPDRELERDIILALYPEAQVGPYMLGDEDWSVFHAEPLVRNKAEMPKFTASIDAAMTLVDEQCEINVHRYQRDKENGRRWRANLTHWPDPPIPLPLTTTWYGHGSSAALALCAAALKARAGGEHDNG